jgi:hypothetical protein
MPLAKIHVVEGRYDEARMAKVSDAIQAALMSTLRVSPEDFYPLIFELPALLRCCRVTRLYGA